MFIVGSKYVANLLRNVMRWATIAEEEAKGELTHNCNRLRRYMFLVVKRAEQGNTLMLLA